MSLVQPLGHGELHGVWCAGAGGNCMPAPFFSLSSFSLLLSTVTHRQRAVSQQRKVQGPEAYQPPARGDGSGRVREGEVALHVGLFYFGMPAVCSLSDERASFFFPLRHTRNEGRPHPPSTPPGGRHQTTSSRAGSSTAPSRRGAVVVYLHNSPPPPPAPPPGPAHPARPPPPPLGGEPARTRSPGRPDATGGPPAGRAARGRAGPVGESG